MYTYVHMYACIFIPYIHIPECMLIMCLKIKVFQAYIIARVGTYACARAGGNYQNLHKKESSRSGDQSIITM